jgi:glutamyl-tRNA reductase
MNPFLPYNQPDIEQQSDALEPAAINHLRLVLEQIRLEEMARYSRKLPQPELNLAEALSKDMMQKILQVPLFRLRTAEKEGVHQEQANLLKKIFTHPVTA